MRILFIVLSALLLATPASADVTSANGNPVLDGSGNPVGQCCFLVEPDGPRGDRESGDRESGSHSSHGGGGEDRGKSNAGRGNGSEGSPDRDPGNSGGHNNGGD